MRQAVLVTGAAKRLGRATALYLAEKGYDIALHYHSSESEALATSSDIRAFGVDCELMQADLADAGCFSLLIEQAYARFPLLSALVNNASVFDRGSFMQSSQALYAREFRINLEAPMFLTQAFAKTVGKGCVVNMLDSRIFNDKHAYSFYLLSKKALYGFTRMAAAELGPNIRVNGVCPGFILPVEEFGEEYQQKLETRLPLRQIASTADIAQAVYSLIITGALTGQCLFVDGGEHLQ